MEVPIPGASKNMCMLFLDPHWHRKLRTTGAPEISPTSQLLPSMLHFPVSTLLTAKSFRQRPAYLLRHGTHLAFIVWDRDDCYFLVNNCEVLAHSHEVQRCVVALVRVETTSPPRQPKFDQLTRRRSGRSYVRGCVLVATSRHVLPKN